MDKKEFYLKLFGPIALIIYMIIGIQRGEHHLPGRDVVLLSDPDRFWQVTAFFVVLALLGIAIVLVKNKRKN